MTEDSEDDPFLDHLPDEEIQHVILKKFLSEVYPLTCKITPINEVKVDQNTDISPVSDNTTGKIDVQEVLSICRETLHQQWVKGHDDSAMLQVTHLFSILSRERAWAVAFSECGVLDHLLEILQPNIKDSYQWIDDALRLIANCCSRSLRVKRSTYPRAPYPRLVHRLLSKSMADTSAMVIYAISNGLDDTLQELEAHHHLISHFLEGLGRDFYMIEHLDFLFELIEGIGRRVSAQFITDFQLRSLINCITSLHLPIENITVLVHLLSRLLEDDKIRDFAIRLNFRSLLQAFMSTYPANILEHSQNDRSLMTPSFRELTEDKDIHLVRSILITCFGKVTLSLQDLALVQQELPTLLNWLKAPLPQMQICACVFFGNVAFNTPILGSLLLLDHEIGLYLSQCIAHTSDREVLTSAFELLQNLGKIENRNILGDAGMLETLAARWEKVDIHSSRALYHTRQLLNASPHNTLIFLHQNLAVDDGFTTQPSLLSRLVVMFNKTDDSTILAETGQVIAEIWRNLSRYTLDVRSADEWNAFRPNTTHGTSASTTEDTVELAEHNMTTSHMSTGAGNEDQRVEVAGSRVPASSSEHMLNPTIVDELFKKVGTVSVIDPVIHLIKSGNESLISLGWFTLSLMAMHPAGSTAVYEQFIQDGDNFELLKATMDSSNAQSGARNNALYLVAKLSQQLIEANDEDSMECLNKLPIKVAEAPT